MSADTRIVIAVAGKDAYLGVMQASENLLDDEQEYRWQTAEYLLSEGVKPPEEGGLGFTRHESLAIALSQIPSLEEEWRKEGWILEYPDPLVVELDVEKKDVRKMVAVSYL